MTRLGDLEVKVKIDDTYAVEYEDDDGEAGESEPVTTKYIEAVSGASFGITCRVLSTYHFNEDFLSFQIFVDGKRAGGMHFFSTKHSTRRGQSILLHHVSVGWNNDRKRLRYRFADLRTREALPDEEVEDLRAEYQSLGTISVQVWRKQHLGLRLAKSHTSTNKIGVTDPVPEKALKGRALSVAASLEPDGMATPKSHVLRSRALDDLPLATFNFKYRSRRDLQSLLILPRSPSPIRTDERPVDELGPEELHELIAQQRAQLEAIKQEDKRGPILKRERPLSGFTTVSRPTKTSRSADGKPIYHLDSDDEGKSWELMANIAPKTEMKIEVVDLMD